MVVRRKGKKMTVENDEENSGAWCFICKDGGDTMRFCDRKKCGKPYHPSCVKKDDSFLTGKDHWVCGWHTCSDCGGSSYYHCYMCINALCRSCLHANVFAIVKGQYGFCKECLDRAVLIERKEDVYNADGEKVDFTDRNTEEGLFREYYDIIKKEKGIEARDVFAADESLKTKNEHQSESGSDEYDEEEEEEEEDISDYDGSDHVKRNKRKRKEKRSEREKSASKTPMKSSKDVFIGWASRSLITFLTSIGESTDKKLSQDDVTSIMYKYVKEHKLLHREKRKYKIMCDELLYSVFRRKTIDRYKVYDLLEDHFAENQIESEENELGSDSEDENEASSCKRKRKGDSENGSPKMELEDGVRLSCFASIIVENIKLVYLKKNLLGKLLEQPETFEEKVIGGFVRVKSDPHDCRSKNSYQLVQVEGVKKISSGENNTQVVLQVSATPKDISIDLLSDADISKEECEDLRRRMVSGQLKRPTVGDLQQKAKILHEDITNHWIKNQLMLLGKHIERANEKGWRRELHEYRERRKKLETPLEKERLLRTAPQVIPDAEVQLESNVGDITRLTTTNPPM